jgi:DNA-binding transcriptional ArsR family regulator
VTAYDSALAAIADPTRRGLLERLREAPASVTELTRSAGISQPAVSQHLKVLEKAGLVAVAPQGARRIYRLNAAGLEEVRSYIESFWQDALAAFATEAEERRGDASGDARPS